ncbi:hypothetical protein Droror1_Dr00006203 [Drosera rotundifolia]
MDVGEPILGKMFATIDEVKPIEFLFLFDSSTPSCTPLSSYSPLNPPPWPRPCLLFVWWLTWIGQEGKSDVVGWLRGSNGNGDAAPASGLTGVAAVGWVNEDEWWRVAGRLGIDGG